MERKWLILAVIFYPFVALAPPLLGVRLDRYGALASGLIVFLVLWLYALPRDLEWSLGPVAWASRFVVPLTAYLGGLAVAALLMSWTRRERP